MNKQNLWFITLLSIILILSIYYISIPSNTIFEYTNTPDNDVTEVVSESTNLVALRVSDDEEVLNTIQELQTTLLDKNTTIEEKNLAYESLKNINATQGKEEEIEKILKDEFNYESFVKISQDQINIVISSAEHDKTIANKIITRIQSLFEDKKYITIKFQ